MNRESYDLRFHPTTRDWNLRPLARESVIRVNQKDVCVRGVYDHYVQDKVDPANYAGRCGMIAMWNAARLLGKTFPYQTILSLYPNHSEGLDGYDIYRVCTSLGLDPKVLSNPSLDEFVQITNDPRRVLIASCVEADTDEHGYPSDGEWGGHYVVPIDADTNSNTLRLLNPSARKVGPDCPLYGIQEVKLSKFYEEHWWDEGDQPGTCYLRSGIVASL